MIQNKPRVIKDYEKLENALQEQIKLLYPYGFSQNLITFTDKDGRIVSALPFETDDKYYLLRMTPKEAHKIIEDDEDYDPEGNLKMAVKEDYESKHAAEADLEFMDEVADEEDDSYDDDDYGDDDDDDDDDNSEEEV